MKRSAPKHLLSFLLPLMFLTLGPAKIMVCKMGMEHCAPCCKEKLVQRMSSTPQVSPEKLCCVTYSRALIATKESTPKIPDYLNGKGWAFAAHIPSPVEFTSWAWKVTYLHHAGPSFHPPPLYLLKTSLLC